MRIPNIVCLAILPVAVACSKEEYGYVATLGNDTISIEHITRKRNTITGDLVERSPRVIRKHWTVKFNSDGSLHDWTMEERALNLNAENPPLVTYKANLVSDSFLTVPWEAYDYGTYELLFEQAAKQNSDTVPVRQVQPGYGQHGKALVRKQKDGSVTFVSTGLAGTGVAQLDANGRMKSYSGKHTTYKQEVVRTTDIPDIDAIAARFAAAEKNAPVKSLSPLDTTTATIGPATLTIEYSRPGRRGRNIMGDVVEYDKVWRTGANKATHFTTTAPLNVSGVAVPPGTYTLWTLPTKSGVFLIINHQTGQWGTRYDPRRDLARIPMTVTTTPTRTENFTIAIDRSALRLEWDNFRWMVSVMAQ
ncbi:MAG TPA: DUF2911 domain-containing protein [Longimicrobiales bacterium]|nr:DUF2911 domain-containing protein [Longimicrobiales bacterium]